MYRLLKNTSLKVNGANFSKIQLNHPLVTPCTLCNQELAFLSGIVNLSSKILTRNLTSIELAVLRASLKKKKKYKKVKKKYAELLEVNENSSNITKAVVKNLSAKQVSKLAENPEATLEHLQNVAEQSILPTSAAVDKLPQTLISKEYTAFFDNIDLPPVDNALLEHETEKEMEWELILHNKKNIDMIPEASLTSKNESEVDMKRIKNVTPKKKILNAEAIEKNKILKEKEREFIIEKFNNNLASYIDLCVYCDYLNVGFGTLTRYTNKIIRKNQVFSVRSARPFNSLMHGYAKKGNVEKVMELLRTMRSCGISPNAQSYAAAFEALGRHPSEESVIEKLKFLEQDMKAKGFKFQHMFEHCFYVADQRECVLKSIHRLDENFVPHYHPPVMHYNCSLLKDLNKQSGKSYHSPSRGLVTDEQMEDFIEEQLKTELASPIKIKSVVKPPVITEEIKQYRAKWSELMDMWRMSIREALVRDLEVMKMQQNATKLCNSINIYPYLKALTIEQYVDIILQEIRKLVQGSETFSPNLKLLQKSLGHQVRLKYEVKHKQQYGIMSKMEKIYKSYCKWYLNPEVNPTAVNTRQQWQHLLHSNVANGASLTDNEEMWPPNVIQGIGRFLYNIIVKDIKTDVNCFRPNSSPEYLPAFYSLFRYQGRFLIEELKPHPQLVRLYKECYSDDLFFDANLLPMVSPPVPWTTVKAGGYVISKADFIRLHYGASIKSLEDVAPQRLYPVFDSLNQLSAVPWRINEKVLDVVLEVFRKGGSAKLDIPEHSSNYVPSNLPFGNTKSLTYRQRAILNRKKAEMYGLWCEALYRLSLANHFRDRVFWLPHNIDFRGRVYPVPPHLTHLGNDMARSLLFFAKGNKLGPDGLDWLKIHCINLTGLKKHESLANRLKYANEILPDILDSAEKPLTGKMWWTNSDEQWQTLACCMEIKAAMESGDPENFVSHFPVHQDGSCNGLQHYAALGRDQVGAASVNLAPSDIPRDVYSCVVDLVEAERIKDAANGSDIAKSLEGIIKRKVIKQTIMTTVYGVTRYGARLQIAKQLKDVENFPENLVWPASGYLTTKTFFCLQEMFTASREIQDWFTKCAKFIAEHCGSNVEWQTPLGLPVVQPYSVTKVSQLLNDKNGKCGNLNLEVILKPNVMKQKNAFPPNFVHSLDSSHMMLTSLFCEREGITFVSVHDCYWTHPCTINIMNEICRKQFVALHSEPILENLSSYLTKKFASAYSSSKNLDCELSHEVLTKVPKKGDFDLKTVLESTYFFS